MASQHADQLSTLGVAVSRATPERIVFHETGGYTWDGPALEIIKRAGESEKRGDAAAVLRELVVEPSGLIEAVLQRLGATPEGILVRLDEVERHPARTQHRFDTRTLSGVSESFAPAQPTEVWELLANPARMPLWEPSVGGVDDAPAEPEAGDTWVFTAPTRRPDGKPVRIKPQYRSGRVELLQLDVGQVIEWRFTYPDALRANARRIRVELEPAAGGTHLRLTLRWERISNSKRLRRRILSPLHRFFIWLQLSQLGAGISRASR